MFSNGDTTVTITMNPGYKWSDGTRVTSADVAFDIDVIRAAVKENTGNWAYYQVGEFPDDLSSLSTPDQNTLVLNLTSAVNPGWFTLDELATLQPMPTHAWSKASANAPILDCGVPANAKKVYDYLSAASTATSTWATNKLWQLVDGPFRLTSYNHGSGSATLSDNRSYSGLDYHKITTLNLVVAASDSAELSALEAGNIDAGYVPSSDVSQVPQIRSSGYAVFGYPDFGWSFAVYNFKDKTGDFNHIVAQLYFRQAMAHLQNQHEYISSILGGAGSPGYGPVPQLPANPYTPANAKDPYPFSVSAASTLLSGHGWKVVPGGTDTCADPGSGGRPVRRGHPPQAPSWRSTSSTPTTPRSSRRSRRWPPRPGGSGISITLVSSTFINIITNDDDAAYPANDGKWAMEDFGGFTNSTYPTTFTVFNTSGYTNFGGYSDPQADALINASISNSNPDAVTNEAAYLTAQQPALFQPNTDVVYAWKTTLSGPQNAFADLTQYFFNPEGWYYTK